MRPHSENWRKNHFNVTTLIHIIFMDNRRKDLLTINFITCFKADIYKAHAPKIDPSPTFHKVTQV